MSYIFVNLWLDSANNYSRQRPLYLIEHVPFIILWPTLSRWYIFFIIFHILQSLLNVLLIMSRYGENNNIWYHYDDMIFSKIYLSFRDDQFCAYMKYLASEICLISLISLDLTLVLRVSCKFLWQFRSTLSTSIPPLHLDANIVIFYKFSCLSVSFSKLARDSNNFNVKVLDASATRSF